MSFLILSCSLNLDSNSRLLAKAALAACKKTGADTTFADLRDLPLPLCDGATAYGDPNVQRLGAMIQAATGIIVAVPIYNYSVNAALKNAIELTGRAWAGKTVAFLCAAGGQGSYMSIMGIANSLMLDFRCVIVPRFVYATGEAFEGETLSDPDVSERIGRLVAELQALAAAHQQAGGAE